MKALNFLSLKEILARLNIKNSIYINVFCYEIELTYPLYVLDQKFKDCTDLLLIDDENKSRYVCIKDFNRFMCN